MGRKKNPFLYSILDEALNMAMTLNKRDKLLKMVFTAVFNEENGKLYFNWLKIRMYSLEPDSVRLRILNDDLCKFIRDNDGNLTHPLQKNEMRLRSYMGKRPGRKADTRSLLEIFTENGKRNGKTKEQAEEYYQLFAESIGEGIDAQQQAKHVVRCIKYGYLPEQRPPYKKIREELPGFKESAKRFVSEQLKK